MAISAQSYFASILLVIVLSTSYQGVSGQCWKNTTGCVNILLTTGDTSKEKVCRTVNTFLTCVEDILQVCGIGANTMAKAREQAVEFGCSSSRTLGISTICLIMAAVIHLFLQWRKIHRP